MSFTKSFAKYVTKNPVLVFSFSLFVLLVSVFGANHIVNESLDYESMIPNDLSVMETSTYYVDNFGSFDSATLVIEVVPIDKDESVKTIYDPAVIKYSESLANYVSTNSENIENINTPSYILRLLHNGTIPNSVNVISDDFKNNFLLQRFVSQDQSMLVLSIQLQEGYETKDLISELNDAIISVKTPQGIETNIGGSSIADSMVLEELDADMARTGRVSMLGIVFILFLTFMSIKYAFLPLFTLIFGVTWTFGFVGLLGIPMNSATSGVLSMIMGIGIDFGIQMITRYRQELKHTSIKSAMEKTLSVNFYPMFTATLCAVVGFKAMGLGQLTLMKDMGDIMAMGVIFCFFAAITILPSFTIILEQIIKQAKKKTN